MYAILGGAMTTDFFDFSNGHFIIAIVLSVINAVLLCYEGYKFMQIIQLNGYHNRGYFDWLKNTRAKYVLRLAMLSLISVATLIVTNAIFNAFLDYLAYLGLIIYFILSIFFIVNVYTAPKKTPLKMTNRMTRSMILLFILHLAISFGVIVLSSMFIDILRFGAVALTPLIVPITVPFVHWVMKPLEKAINQKYVHQAKKKMQNYPDLIKIGITGSYGKTSVKNFLDTILSEKYNVLSTPFNYNTTMGVTKSIIQFLEFSHQIFIAEMGARTVGDIEELCDIVKPKYAIITPVGEQHMATFHTIDNVVKTKSELPKSLPDDGMCVFNLDNKYAEKIAQSCVCDKKFVSIDNKDCDVYASDVETTTEGTKFKLHIGKDVLECYTKVLGKHNIVNILLCIPLCIKLGLTLDQIKQGIEKISPVDHRLQLIKSENDVLVLDDAYNASIEGSKRALEVLSMFKDRRKIVITPGLVELGNLERLANFNFGKDIAKVADLVVIVNKTHYLAIREGLIEGGFDESNIFEAETFETAQAVLKDIVCAKDIILWENDLPDNYT